MIVDVIVLIPAGGRALKLGSSSSSSPSSQLSAAPCTADGMLQLLPAVFRILLLLLLLLFMPTPPEVLPEVSSTADTFQEREKRNLFTS